MADSNIGLALSTGEGVGGSSFGGAAPIYAPDAAQSLVAYLFSPIVEEHEVLDWELRASERAAATAAVADTPATRDIYADNAETSGLRISLLEPSGAAGNAWSISRGINSGAIRFESVADLQRIRLAGELFNNVTTFGQILAAVNAVTFISAVYFGGANDATTIVSSGVLIPGGGGNFLGGVDGTPAVAEEAISATADAANRAILLRIRDTDTVGDIKPIIDSVDGLGAEYQGGIVDAAVASRALPWTEPFTLITVVGGPEGPRGLEGMLTAADQQAVNAARDAAQASATAAAASAVDADSSETNAETAQATAVAAGVASGVARDLAVDARDEAGNARNAAQGSQVQAGQSATAAEASRLAAEAARDAAQAQSGFTAALTNAVTGNVETGIDATVDGNGKLNLVVTASGGVTPALTHNRYAALTLAHETVAADFVDPDNSASSNSEDVQLPIFTENRFLTFTHQDNLPDPVFIGVKNGQNQIGGFIKLADRLGIPPGASAVQQAQWQHVDGNGEPEVVYPVLSGTVWTIR